MASRPAKKKPVKTAKAAKPAADGACKKCGQVHTRCTAHKKHKVDGKYVACNQHPLKTSRTRKCRNHGGASPKGIASPHYVDGSQCRDKRFKYLPAPMAKRVEEMAEDELKALAQNTQLQRALESRYHEMLDTGESPAAWASLRELLKRQPRAELASLMATFGMIARIVSGQLGERSVEDRILEIHEAQRKMTDTLTKCRKDIQETITLAFHHEILSELVGIIRRHVRDRPTLEAIDTDVRRLGFGEQEAIELPVRQQGA